MDQPPTVCIIQVKKNSTVKSIVKKAFQCLGLSDPQTQYTSIPSIKSGSEMLSRFILLKAQDDFQMIKAISSCEIIKSRSFALVSYLSNNTAGSDFATAHLQWCDSQSHLKKLKVSSKPSSCPSSSSTSLSMIHPTPISENPCLLFQATNIMFESNTSWVPCIEIFLGWSPIPVSGLDEINPPARISFSDL